jgi:hypothetical protein
MKYIIPGNDAIILNADGSISINGLIVNDNGLATGDLRSESDTEANMIFLDASEDLLYLGGTAGIKIGKDGMIILNAVSFNDEPIFLNDDMVFL